MYRHFKQKGPPILCKKKLNLNDLIHRLNIYYVTSAISEPRCPPCPILVTGTTDLHLRSRYEQKQPVEDDSRFAVVIFKW